MARRIYQLKRQYDGEEEEIVSTSTRKKEIERDFNRMVRVIKSQKGTFVEEVRLCYARFGRYLTFGQLRIEVWVCIAPLETES